MALAILVTGGAGYIGSHMVKHLVRAGHGVTAFDDLSTGHLDALRGVPLLRGDLKRPEDILGALRVRPFDLVMHFAASCYVGESMAVPAKYYANNVAGSMNLLEAMRATDVRRLVFSSTCSTYGNPIREVIDESHPQQPVNPYGASKLAVERMMRDYSKPYGLDTIALRYFNAAGCDPEGELGERHEPETHLIPLVLREAMRTRMGGPPDGTALEIYGDDFDTPDGTCIRDYVHVADLCDAHERAMRRLLERDPSGDFEAFNLGTGRGYSVKQVIEACRLVTGEPIAFRLRGRRPGDPSRLVASSGSARETLGWSPKFTGLPEIIGTAWHWMLGAAQREFAGKAARK